MFHLAVVHQGIFAYDWGLIFRTQIAGETHAISVLVVLLQFLVGLATDIALRALITRASLSVFVSLRLARKFFPHRVQVTAMAWGPH